MIRGTKRRRSVRSRQFFCSLAARQSHAISRRVPQDAAIGRRYQEKADESEDRQQVHEHIPTKPFLPSIVKSTPRAIRKRLVAEVRRPTFGTSEQLRRAVFSCPDVPPQTCEHSSHTIQLPALRGFWTTDGGSDPSICDSSSAAPRSDAPPDEEESPF